MEGGELGSGRRIRRLTAVPGSGSGDLDPGGVSRQVD